MEALARKINELRAEDTTAPGLRDRRDAGNAHPPRRIIIYENALELVSQVERTNPDFERILEAAK